jgi:hypothetical protein
MIPMLSALSYIDRSCDIYGPAILVSSSLGATIPIRKFAYKLNIVPEGKLFKASS